MMIRIPLEKVGRIMETKRKWDSKSLKLNDVYKLKATYI